VVEEAFGDGVLSLCLWCFVFCGRVYFCGRVGFLSGFLYTKQRINILIGKRWIIYVKKCFFGNYFGTVPSNPGCTPYTALLNIPKNCCDRKNPTFVFLNIFCISIFARKIKLQFLLLRCKTAECRLRLGLRCV